MDRQEIFAEIVAMVEQIDDGGVAGAIQLDDTPFRVYGLTSLAQIRLAALVEDRFDIALSDVDALAANSAVVLVDLIERKISQVSS